MQTLTSEASVALQALKAALPLISPKSIGFASDLIRKGYKYGPSDKQLYWIKKLVEDAKPAPVLYNAVAAAAVAPALPTLVYNAAELFSMFASAAQHLKYPSIELETYDGDTVVFTLMGKGKNAGSLCVTGKGTYPNRAFYGYIRETGAFDASPESRRSGQATDPRLLRWPSRGCQCVR